MKVEEDPGEDSNGPRQDQKHRLKHARLPASRCAVAACGVLCRRRWGSSSPLTRMGNRRGQRAPGPGLVWCAVDRPRILLFSLLTAAEWVPAPLFHLFDGSLGQGRRRLRRVERREGDRVHRGRTKRNGGKRGENVMPRPHLRPMAEKQNKAMPPEDVVVPVIASGVGGAVSAAVSNAVNKPKDGPKDE